MVSKQYESRLSQYMEQQRLLLDVTRQIAGSVGLNETIPHILDGVFRALKPDGVRLLLFESSGRQQTYAAGPSAEMMAQADSHLWELLAGQAARDEVTPHILDAPAVLPGMATLIAVPLVAHQVRLGIVWLGFQEPHDLDDAECTFLSILAGQAAIAIANAQSFEAARQRREWLAAVLASTPDPVLVVDHEMRLQLVNPAAQEMIGSAAAPLIDQPLVQVVAPEISDLFRARSEHGDQALIEYVAENGRVYSPSVSNVCAENGEMMGWVLVLRDISHFKRLNDNMSEFLSTVSHDMRSPLTFMKGYLDMLGMVGELNARQIEFIDKIAIGVIQMSDMVEKILEAGKLDPMTGNYELSREPCDVVELVQKVVSNLVEPAHKKGLEFTHDITAGIPVMNVDRAMLSSAFTNLVENAVKYTPEGGHIHIQLSLQANELLFQVSDNGLGISAEDQSRLFERNVRIRRKEWKRIKGSGLGLFIVRNVAQRHGGDAWVHSAEGEGSTFFLAIPLDGPNLLAGGTPASE